MFDFFDTHDGVKAISYFNYDNRPGMGQPLDTAKDVQLDGGQVNYQSNTNDDDHHLLADSGAGWRQLYSQRISSSRYISTALTEAVGGGSNTRPVATIVSVTVRGRTAIVRWRGNAAAKSFDVGLRKIPGVWKIVESGYTAGSYALHGARGASYAVRVRGRTASGAPGPWSQTRTLSLR